MSATGSDQDLLGSIERGEAPRRILEFAARGFVPLPPGELVRAISSILVIGDDELKELASETFSTFDTSALRDAVGSAGVRAEQLAVIAERTEDTGVLEPLIRHRNVSDETLAWLAERIGPWLQDVLVTNQMRLLASPVIVERLFENPQLSTDIRRRADEFLEEFFLKKEREEDERHAEAGAIADAAAAAEDLPLTSFDEPQAPDAAPTADGRQATNDVELSEEDLKNLTKLSSLSVTQRIRIAYRGNREERLFLVRDVNRLVAMAVLKSPKTREADVEVIANMKSVSEDVLRVIGQRRAWMRKYTILSSLVRNPRAPLDITLPLLNRLTQRDMKLLAKDRNIPEAIRNNARRVVARYET